MQDTCRHLQTPIVTVLLIFLGLFLYTKLAGPIPFSVNSIQTTKTNLFTTTGTGKAAAVPNTALLSLGVTKTAATVVDAQNQANAVVNKLVADLKTLGVEEKNIKTTNYSVSPDYDFSQGRQIARGYTVTQTLEVKVTPIEKANNAVDVATKNGANIVGSIAFILDDDTKKKLEDDARREAVGNAKEKAESLASATGIKLGRIVDVQESSAGEPFPMRMMLAPGGGETKDQTNLSPGENTVSITITLSYETY